ncbi:MAG TPA: tetratricopeptide repeat protein [Vicinamibacterales bacterium]|jgi:spermidine synthase
MTHRRPFVVCYTLSGAAALVYEVTWTRLLTLQLGHSVAAASTVLAAFMGGLACGSWAAGRWQPGVAARDRESLRLYAALEVAVAILALLLPFVLRGTVPALAWAYADGTTPTRFAFVRIVISLLLVGIPAVAMGATFPVAAAAAAKTPAETGVLYAANTAGAAVGAILAGFWLVPALGIQGSSWVGVSLNLAAAAGALWIRTARESAAPPQAGPAPSRRSRKEPAKPRQTAHAPFVAMPMVAAVAAAVSGCSALVYEVAWTRLLALVIGPTTYAFATMAASFIVGLAIGAALFVRVARTTAKPATWLGGLLMTGAVAATAAASYAANSLPLTVAAQVASPNADFRSVVMLQAVAVGVVLLPMTLALGGSFPLALTLAGGTDSSVADRAALVYAANTVGAIVGALTAGFVLIPAFGLRPTIVGAALFALAGGVAVMLAARPERIALARFAAIPTLAAAAATIAIFAVPAWDRALLASGAYKYAPYLAGTDLDAVLRAGSLVYYREGSAATVSVRDLSGVRSLAIDGKVDASNGGDMLTQRLLGLLPVLIHGRAEDVAIIGLGSGVTVGSALATGTVRHADVIEISPEVVEASRFFDRESGRALAQPGVRLIVGDGRSHLLLSDREYDIIVSEPSNPWMAGVASLFTREFFDAVRTRLKPDGIVCQWAHTYDIRPEDLRSIVRTFAAAFPESTMWLVGGGDLLLIGSKSGHVVDRLDSMAAAARDPRVDAVLADVGVAPHTAPFVLLSMYAGGPREIDRLADTAPIQSDDRSALEYSAPRGIYGRTREDNAATIRALAPVSPPAVARAVADANDAAWTSKGLIDLRAQVFAGAYDAFRRGVALNPRNVRALSGLSDAAGGAGKLDDERQWLESLAQKDSTNADVRIELSRVLAVMGKGQAAAAAASDALKLAPDDPRAADQLASVFADEGDGQRLAALAEQLVLKFPDSADSRYYQATALFLNGRTAEAADIARRVVAAHPEHARAQNLLGAACASLGQRECAQGAFDASIRNNPRDPSGYVNAGVFNLQVANLSSAASYFANALAIDPSSSAAREGLARARSSAPSR